MPGIKQLPKFRILRLKTASIASGRKKQNGTNAISTDLPCSAPHFRHLPPIERQRYRFLQQKIRKHRSDVFPTDSIQNKNSYEIQQTVLFSDSESI